MRLFGYYALHTFVNQLRKLFRTWVLVFILICGLMGGLIGFGAGTLADSMEADEPEIVEEAEEEWNLSIPPESLVQLAVGGGILVIFLYQAISADTNGGKIFQPADVNLLFSSPMSPQSVLMFRLATQLGMSAAMLFYLIFQLPNLIYNLNLSPWTAAGIVIVFAIAVLVGKLIQLFLYLLSSSKPFVKKNLRNGIYAVVLVLAVAFFGYFQSSEKDLLGAADGFFNGKIAGYVPLWGWLVSLYAAIAAESIPTALLYFSLLAAVCGVMVYGIWHMDVDFYEDAMAKSEETAALMEKARSEKSTGVTAVRQRKKERKDTLLRDGMRHGQGANVFFYKTMYNRFRFSHFHFFTKTMETYLATAVGMGLLDRLFIQSQSVLPTVLAIGGLVFFRAMGNPLEEDTGMDFFRLIPESTWKKLFYSQLGGTVNCLLDVLPALLIGAGMLTVNPVKLLVWLPVIVSVDFYASTVGAFIDLSVPIAAGKTIKQFVQILFIYFGLIPDAAILAVAIVNEQTVWGALGTTAVNVLLGLLFLSLAATCIEPKGKEAHAAAQNVDLRKAKKAFSRAGFAVCATLVIASAAQVLAGILAGACFPGIMDYFWGQWLLTFAPMYLVGFPIGFRMLRKIPSHQPEMHKLGWKGAGMFFFLSAFGMYAGNLIGTLITTAIGLWRSAEVVNPLEAFVDGTNVWMQVLFMVVLAPIFEELLFRKKLIDKLGVYGAKTAVLLSALLFGLFHGNLSQFFYAFFLGLVFGYVYVNTGRIQYTITAHMIINLFGGVISVELLNRDGIGIIIYSVCVIVSAVTGFVLLLLNRHKAHYPAAELELPKGKRFVTSCCNAGMAFAFLGSFVLIALSLLA